jgi:hypothetical protein
MLPNLQILQLLDVPHSRYPVIRKSILLQKAKPPGYSRDSQEPYITLIWNFQKYPKIVT